MSLASPRHILLLFVDGVGLPAGPLADSIYAGCPTLQRLFESSCVPLDASLGVPGIPQSATGQTALFTGVNAAQELGRHCEGFPGAELRAIIESGNLFAHVLAAGKRCTFANAYASRPGHELPMLHRSVTTVMTLSALGATRNRDALSAGRAVYHDITREVLVSLGDPQIPVVSEEAAAEHLIAVLHSVDVCLFEYFLTDHVGHRGDLPRRRHILASLERFITALLRGMDPLVDLFLLVSDHGNIEECAKAGHSTNPVPWVAVGAHHETALAGMTSILDVTPRVLALAGVPPRTE